MVSLPQNPWEANEWSPVKVWSVTSLALNSLYIFLFSDLRVAQIRCSIAEVFQEVDQKYHYSIVWYYAACLLLPAAR